MAIPLLNNIELDSNIVDFGTVPRCNEPKLMVRIKNHYSCYPATITKLEWGSPNIDPFKVITPTSFPRNLINKGEDSLFIQFPNTKTGNFFSKLKVTMDIDGHSYDTSIFVKGTRIATPVVVLSNYSLNFDTVASCSDKDQQTVLVNTSCDTEIVKLNNSLSDYSVILPSGFDTIFPGDSIIIQLRLFSKISGAHHGIVDVNVTPKNSSPNRIVLTLDGYIVQKLPAPELNPVIINFDSVTLCDSIPKHKFALIKNLSQCDSLYIDSVWLVGETNLFSMASSKKIIAPSDSENISILFHTGNKGLHNADLHIRYYDGAKEQDTTIPLKSYVYSGTGILSANVAVLDFGSTTMCDEKDTSINIRNIGCDTLQVSGVGGLGSGFGTNTTFPIIILPGDSAKVDIFTILDTAGGKLSNSASLTFTSNSDNTIPPITLSHSFIAGISHNLGLFLDATPQSGGDLSTVTYTIKEAPGKSFSGAGVNSLNFVLNYNTDVLNFTPSKSSANLSSANGKNFTITGSPITADANGILASVGFTVYLTKDSTTNIILTNRNDTTLSPCGITTLSMGGSATFDYQYLCGERSISSYLRDGSILHITSIHPNPAQDELEIDLQSGLKQDASIEIFNALGARVYFDSQNLISGDNKIHLITKNLSSGVYLVKVGGVSQSLVISR